MQILLPYFAQNQASCFPRFSVFMLSFLNLNTENVFIDMILEKQLEL